MLHTILNIEYAVAIVNDIHKFRDNPSLFTKASVQTEIDRNIHRKIKVINTF